MMQEDYTRKQLVPFTAKETADYYAHGIVPARFEKTEERKHREIIARYAATVPTGTWRTL